MSQEITILILTAASIGFFHTLFGPDHYLPFIVMAKARNWSMMKTISITFACGIGHVLSSVILGLIGIALGLAVAGLEFVEAIRGDIAAYLLIAFGAAYFIWGVKKAIRNKPHTHTHLHIDGTVHLHEHKHSDEHIHTHEQNEKRNITPWILFTIFIFGPCEPLIPILMYPASEINIPGMILVTAVFGLVTIATMISLVVIAVSGINMLPFNKAERYMHALAGFAILASGIAIVFLGL